MSPDSLLAATSLLAPSGCCRGERGLDSLVTLVLKIDISETNYAGIPGTQTRYKYLSPQDLGQDVFVTYNMVCELTWGTSQSIKLAFWFLS